MLSSNNEWLNKLVGFGLLVAFAAFGIFAGSRIVNIPRREELILFVLVLSFVPILKFYRAGLYALFFVPPFVPYVRRLFYLAYSRPEIDLLILLPDSILVLTLIGFFLATAGEKEENGFVLRMKRLLIFYVAFLLVRTFVFNDAPAKDAFMRFKFYGPFVLCFFLGTAAAMDLRMLRKFGIIALLIAAAGAAYGIRQLHAGFGLAEKLWLQSVPFDSLFIGDIARPFSFFASPAAFADMAQIGILLALPLTILCTGWMRRALMIALIGLFGYAMLVTSVRSSWIGGISTFLFWFFIFRKQGGAARLTNLVIVLLVVAAVLFANDYFESIQVQRQYRAVIASQEFSAQNKMDMLVKQRMSAVTNPLQEHSMASRLGMWGIVFYYSTQFSMGFFGRGLGQFSADSLYITYLAEFGYPGMLLILILLFLLIRYGLRVYDQLETPFMRAVARAILTLNFVFLIVNITGTHIHNYPGDFFFWFCNGILLKLRDSELHNRDQFPLGQPTS